MTKFKEVINYNLGGFSPHIIMKKLIALNLIINQLNN